MIATINCEQVAPDAHCFCWNQIGQLRSEGNVNPGFARGEPALEITPGSEIDIVKALVKPSHPCDHLHRTAGLLFTVVELK